MVFGWYFLFGWQVDAYVSDWHSLFEADAFYLLEVDSCALVVGYVVHDSLLYAHVGDFLEVNEELVGHVLEFHVLADRLLGGQGDLYFCR